MSTTIAVATIAARRIVIFPVMTEVRPTTSDGTGRDRYFSRARKPTIDAELLTIQLPSRPTGCVADLAKAAMVPIAFECATAVPTTPRSNTTPTTARGSHPCGQRKCREVAL